MGYFFPASGHTGYDSHDVISLKALFTSRYKEALVVVSQGIIITFSLSKEGWKKKESHQKGIMFWS